jgi:hypothetical protein
MKRILPVVLALFAGCVSVPSGRGGEEAKREPSAAEREVTQDVRSAFRTLISALIEADSLATLSMMTVQGISDWILERTWDASDGVYPKCVKELDSARKVDYEHWLKANKDVRMGFVNRRSTVLPESILTSKWLIETWKKYIEFEKDSQGAIAREVESGEIWVDGTEASVTVRLSNTFARMYSFKLENGQWKYDYDVRPANNRR